MRSPQEELRTLQSLVGRFWLPRHFPVLACLGAVALLLSQLGWHILLVRDLLGLHPGDPWPVWLVRLLPSAFAPAVGLPPWGAIAQVIIVVGLAERRLGRSATIAIGAVGHVCATVFGRVLILAGAGLVHDGAGILDTGPSAAVTALAVALCVRQRLSLTTLVLASGLILALAAHPGLSGWEHAMAMGVGLCGGLLPRARFAPLGVVRSAVRRTSPEARAVASP